MPAFTALNTIIPVGLYLGSALKKDGIAGTGPGRPVTAGVAVLTISY
ncbi:hypothetical protein HMPREF1570_2938 [Klebsiella oxytoca KA-2]|nr:hypothetical protein HMPREF1570_2938 [Klebsiella oxytoca KA-2]